ncbi:MAG: NTP/NDP exchange transporter [Candidatus Paracaedibacteraceae bacterium]|nr:NTP/NDP exchange transporter [Candidatus Paracaedibacteraceae bacterium]
MSQAKEAVKQPEFTGLRAILWPIHNYEIKKFLPMGLMMFCILFNYTVLRDTKDALVVNAPGSGAEALAFIKLAGTTPAAVLFMIAYAKMSNVFSRQGLFYAALLPFLVFFGAFALFIYPNREALHMTEEAIAAAKVSYPQLAWFVPVIGNWSYSLFYILSELWGSAVISLLFWQFANEITRVTEAKRFYGMFGLIGNFGLILSGYTVYFFSQNRDNLPEGVDAWGWTLNYLMAFVVIAGLIVVAIYSWMNKSVLTDPRYYDGSDVAKGSKKKDKPKLSLGESFMYLVKSPYLGMIAMIVLAYGVSINIVEGVWKGQIKIAFHGDNNAYNAFMGQFSATTGAITVVLMVAGNNILRRFSWLSAAMITPIMILITSLIFFGVIMYSESVGNPEYAVAGTTMVMVAVMTGFVQNVLSKATKYSLFDPTKEMAYIPLDQELKVKGKAAVDVIGGRAGKSGGALVQASLLSVFAGQTLASLSHILAVVTIVVVALWLVSVLSLSKRFKALTEQREAEAQAAAK